MTRITTNIGKNVVVKGENTMVKIVSISSERQITIPQEFFVILGFTDKAECILRGEELIIRPVGQYPEESFSEQILADLIAQGLEGDELLKQYEAKQAQIRPAVELMIKEAKSAACGNSEYSTYGEVFDDHADRDLE